MGVPEGFEESLAAKFSVIFPHLDERQRRLLMGAEARVIGHGGIRLVARAAGAAEITVSDGVRGLEDGGEPLGRVRRAGGGRQRGGGGGAGCLGAGVGVGCGGRGGGGGGGATRCPRGGAQKNPPPGGPGGGR